MTVTYRAEATAAVAARLGVDPPFGLPTGEALRRAMGTGPNALEGSTRRPAWRMVAQVR